MSSGHPTTNQWMRLRHNDNLAHRVDLLLRVNLDWYWNSIPFHRQTWSVLMCLWCKENSDCLVWMCPKHDILEQHFCWFERRAHRYCSHMAHVDRCTLPMDEMHLEHIHKTVPFYYTNPLWIWNLWHLAHSLASEGQLMLKEQAKIDTDTVPWSCRYWCKHRNWWTSRWKQYWFGPCRHNP